MNPSHVKTVKMHSKSSATVVDSSYTALFSKMLSTPIQNAIPSGNLAKRMVDARSTAGATSRALLQKHDSLTCLAAQGTMGGARPQSYPSIDELSEFADPLCAYTRPRTLLASHRTCVNCACLQTGPAGFRVEGCLSVQGMSSPLANLLCANICCLNSVTKPGQNTGAQAPRATCHLVCAPGAAKNGMLGT